MLDLGFLCTAIGGLLSLFGLVIWVWMLVDCLKNEPSQGNDKLIWVLVILIGNILGAVLYLIIRRPERIRTYGY